MKFFVSNAILLLLILSLSVSAQSANNKGTFWFKHGVASGDPLQNSVLVWTRIEGLQKKMPTVKVGWEVATDTLFTQIVAKGDDNANLTNDGTVQVEVKGLLPDTKYFYRFSCQGMTSPVGRTKTLPVEADSVKLAVVSCSNYEAGYFNAYRALASHSGIDAVVHLGDYIYEYEPSAHGDSSLPRKHLPAKEITSLPDYRGRYAQYREDADLQELHRLHPFIVVWDDHEIANNSWREGAQNHQPEKEGVFTERKQAALQAYFEWLPIRQFNDTIYRRFDFGQLATLWMLDGRQYRDKQPALGDSTVRFEHSRTLLGTRQFDWLVQGLRNSNAAWNILGNDVMMSSVDYGKLLPEGTDFFLDMWDGYPAERNRLMEAMKSSGRQNFIVVTGDIHSSWGFELTVDAKSETYRHSSSTQSLGAEWVTPSITSKNFGEYINNDARTKLFEQILKGSNPHLKYVDLLAHGYLIVTLSAIQAKADWFNARQIKNPADSNMQHVQSMKLEAGSGKLHNLPVNNTHAQ